MEIIQELEQLTRPKLNQNTKDVLGFDLGHGDTSVVRVSAVKPEKQKLEILKGQEVIPTIVGERVDGKVVIGDRAMGIELVKLEQQFKSPEVTNPNVSEPMRAFVLQVFEELRHNVGTISFDDSTLVVFGCPSAWSSTQKLAYGKFLKQFASGMQFMLQPESRAAFITMKEAKELNEQELRESILIVDIGSSTTDFTFTNDLDPKELNIGGKYPLGASHIERQLLNIAVKRSPNCAVIEDWWKRYPSEYNRTLMDYRTAKEKFFSDEEYYRDPATKPIVINSYYYTSEREIELKARLSTSDFDEAIDTPIPILGNQPISWKNRFHNDLIEAQQSIIEILGNPPRFVILTGGAARMGFTEDIVKKVFSAPTIVKRAPEPQNAISTGLAYAGSIRYRTQAFLNEINTIVDSTRVEDIISKHMRSFAETIGNVASKNVTKRFIIPEFVAWRNSDVGKLRGVVEKVSKRMEVWSKSDEGKEEYLKALADWYKTIEKELHEMTAPICIKYNLAVDSLDIPKSLFDPKQPKVHTNPDELFSTAQLILTALIATISFVIGAVLFGAGTALLFPTGPLAPIITGIFLLIVGESIKEQAIEKIMDMELGWSKKLYPESWMIKRLSKGASEVEEKIKTEAILSITGGYPDDYSDENNRTKVDMENLAKQNREEINKKVTAGVEAALKQRADEVSILIS